MTDASIFNGDVPETPVTPPAATTEGQLFTALVGETQKYKTPDDLAKAYANADEFIETLKEENRKLREQSTSAKTIDDVLERMSKQHAAPESDNSPAQEFNPEIVQQLVEKTLIGRETESRKQENLRKADALMKAQFGDKALDVFKQRATSPEKADLLMQMAAQDPQDFMSFFVGASAAVTNSYDAGSVNTTSVASVGGDRSAIEGTKEWAAKIRKTSPSTYWSQEFQYKLQQTVTNNPSRYFGQ